MTEKAWNPYQSILDQVADEYVAVRKERLKDLERVAELLPALLFMAKNCRCGDIPGDFDFVTPLEQGEELLSKLNGGG